MLTFAEWLWGGVANHKHLTGIFHLQWNNAFMNGKSHYRELKKFRSFFQFPGKEIIVADYGDSS
jgi:hypothetical protein